MKLAHRWLLPLCLTWFCVLAASSNVACAQTSGYSFPKYQVMGVVYAPPGSASSVTYTSSQVVGSTDAISTTNGSTNSTSSSVTVGIGLFGFGGSISYNTSNTWGASTEVSNSVAVQTQQGNTVATMGPISSSLGVDHDNDVIYIWLNPVIAGTVTGTGSTATLDWTGLASNSCDINNPAGPPSAYQGVSGCDPNQYPYPDIVGIPVWCLKNPYYPTPSCSQWLPYTSRIWDLSDWGTDPNTGIPLGPGLTMRDYADILQSDPFVSLNGSGVNVCHPTYGPSLDPNLPETINNAPLTPLNGSNYTYGGFTSLINYADPYDPGFVNYNTTNTPQPTGFLPRTCLTPNTANTAAGTTTTATMNRFQPYGTVEYPVPGPNGLPSTYSGKFEYSIVNTTGYATTDTHTVGTSTSYSLTSGLSFGFGPVGFSVALAYGTGNSTTFQQQSSLSNSTTKSSEGDYSVTGPQLSDNYVGPATYNVYFDSVYGTYAFYSDLEPQVTPAELGNIGISISSTPYTPGVTPTYNNLCSPTSTSPCFNFGTFTVGTSIAQLYPVQLTNNSQYQITMVGPAITFSDPGFQLDETDGTDKCSNAVVQPGKTCSLNIYFNPAPSDAPIPIYGTSAKVNANIVAAGTINVSSTSSVAARQNILMTNYAYVRGTITGSSQGATLQPTDSPCTLTSTAPVCVYSFPTTKTQEVYTFTNNYQSAVIISQVVLSDNTDFTATTPASGSVPGCTLGSQVPAKSTCSITLTLNSQTRSLLGVVDTSIAVIGTPGQNWYFGENFQLATAGATGADLPAVTVAGSIGNLSGTYETGCGSSASGQEPCENGGWGWGLPGPAPSESMTLTNSSTDLVTVTITLANLTGGSEPSVVADTTGCGLTVPYPITSTTVSTSTIKLNDSNCTITTTLQVPNCESSVGQCTLTSTGTITIKATANGETVLSQSYTVSESDEEDNYDGFTSNAASISVAISGAELSTTTTAAASEATGSLPVESAKANTALASSANAAAATAYDTGTVNLATNGVTASATWGSGSTPQSVAQALASSVNTVAAAYWQASAVGSQVLLTPVSSCTPTAITPYLQVNGAAWQGGSAVNVATGSAVNLGPWPIGGGTWSWTGPNGFTSTSREIDGIPLSAGANTFVATYTNSNSCQSAQTFVITASEITPYLQVSGAAWQGGATATVVSGSTVNLGPWPTSGGTWNWTGPNGFTSTSREIDAIPLSAGTNTFVATYTDANSVVSTQTFVITVTGGPITPYLQVNGAAWQGSSAATVALGSAVNLGPWPGGGTWSWTGPNGFTSTSREIDSIPLSLGSNTFVATYTDANSVTSTEEFVVTAAAAAQTSVSKATTVQSTGSIAVTVTDTAGFTPPSFAATLTN